jgi:hypothetical protein
MDHPLTTIAVPGAGTTVTAWVFLDAQCAMDLMWEWDFTGTLVGTLTLEFTNASRAEVNAGSYGVGPTKYDAGDYATDEAIAAPEASFFEALGLRCTAARLKFVCSSGAGNFSHRPQSARSA